jgi:predicted DNA-binding protein
MAKISKPAAARITVRMSGQLRQKLEDLAKRDDRKASDYVRRILSTHVRQLDQSPIHAQNAG